MVRCCDTGVTVIDDGGPIIEHRFDWKAVGATATRRGVIFWETLRGDPMRFKIPVDNRKKPRECQ